MTPCSGLRLDSAVAGLWQVCHLAQPEVGDVTGDIVRLWGLEAIVAHALTSYKIVNNDQLILLLVHYHLLISNYYYYLLKIYCFV